ncbi:MAG: hydroxymethylglutaryl-CoA reductase [bacterium]|nr:hydroxymethylglutaryl-CoA reductase [bacterium]
MKIKKSDLILRDSGNNYDCDVIKNRLSDIELKTGCKFSNIKEHSLDTETLTGNIENLIGVTQIPLGVAGPLKVNGDFADGLFYVPMATTEGSLVDSYTRAMLVTSIAGGIKTKILKDEMHITPVFLTKSVDDAVAIREYIEDNFDELKKIAEETTSHGKLIRITTRIFNREIYAKFIFYTGDAMGLNMINISTNSACKHISEKFNNVKFLLRSNLSSDKKPSFMNIINGYGKRVHAECTIPASILNRYFKAAAADIVQGFRIANYSQMQNGSIGLNQHFANGLAAVFIATGQDIAQIVNGACGWSISEISGDNDLYVSITIPNLLVGTVGGGTKVGCQNEALEMIGCYGAGKSKKFAEIIAATILAGELSLGAAMVHGDFISAHTKKNDEIKKNL